MYNLRIEPNDDDDYVLIGMMMMMMLRAVGDTRLPSMDK